MNSNINKLQYFILEVCGMYREEEIMKAFKLPIHSLSTLHINVGLEENGNSTFSSWIEALAHS